MSEREPRLGDVVDDYCSRCRILMNHGVMGLVGAEIKRVRCNTCMNEHAYRHAKIPKPKKDKVKELFDEVLGRIPTTQTTPPSQKAPDPDKEPAPRPRSLHLGKRTTPFREPTTSAGRPGGRPGGRPKGRSGGRPGGRPGGKKRRGGR
jgi:hypothetical protein